MDLECMKIFRFAVIGTFGLVVLVWLVWYLGIPDSYIRSVVDRRVSEGLKDSDINIKGQTYRIEAEIEDIHKSLLPGLRIGALKVIASAQEDRINLLTLKSIILKPSFMEFIAGHPGGRFYGLIGSEGFLKGEAKLKKNEKYLFMVIEVPLKDIEATELLPFKVEGYLAGEVLIENDDVRVRFRIDPFQAGPLVKENLYLPLDLFKRVRGLIELKGGSLHIRSLALEGEKVYGSFSGQFNGKRLKGQFKVIPEEGFPEGLLFALKRYQKTPGLYVIPVNQGLNF